MTDTLRTAVERAVRESGGGARKWEAEKGLPRWAVHGLLDKKRKQQPSLDRAHEICRALGLELDIRQPGEGRRDAPTPFMQGDGDDSPPTSAALSLWPVNVHDLSQGVSPTGCMWFTGNWMRQWGLTKGNLVAIPIRDDAIEPLLPRATAVVDLTRRERRSGVLYGFEPKEGRPFVRRAVRRKDGWRVRRGFPGKDESWPEEAEIMGEVVWASAQFQQEAVALTAGASL